MHKIIVVLKKLEKVVKDFPQKMSTSLIFQIISITIVILTNTSGHIPTNHKSLAYAVKFYLFLQYTVRYTSNTT